MRQLASGRHDYDPDFVGDSAGGGHPSHFVRARPEVARADFFAETRAILWPQRAPLNWWRQARAKVLALLQTKKFDAIWATVRSLVPMALGEEASRVAGIPWVADIRDCFNVQRLGSWYKQQFARQERRLCKAAAHVVAVSDGLAKGLGAKIGREVTVIHNGFDPTLLPEVAPARSDRFTIVYSGALFLPHRDPAPLLQAVELCVQRKLIPREEIEVQFYGSDAALINRTFPGAAERIPVKIFPRVSHHEILRVQMAASAQLLLSHTTEKGVLTGKVFDYLATGQTVLAVPDDHGEISGLLRRTGAGVSASNAEEIAGVLPKLAHAMESQRRGQAAARRGAGGAVFEEGADETAGGDFGGGDGEVRGHFLQRPGGISFGNKTRPKSFLKPPFLAAAPHVTRIHQHLGTE